MNPKVEIVIRGFVEWMGEAIVGLVPLIAFGVVVIFSTPTTKVFHCPVDLHVVDVAKCVATEESPSQEVCILTVVISGLALWSVVCGEINRISNYAKLSVIMCVFALISGAILYALFGEHIDRGADRFSYSMLAVALISSLGLRIEKVISEAAKDVAPPAAAAYIGD